MATCLWNSKILQNPPCEPLDQEGTLLVPDLDLGQGWVKWSEKGETETLDCKFSSLLCGITLRECELRASPGLEPAVCPKVSSSLTSGAPGKGAVGLHALPTVTAGLRGLATSETFSPQWTQAPLGWCLGARPPQGSGHLSHQPVFPAVGVTSRSCLTSGGSCEWGQKNFPPEDWGLRHCFWESTETSPPISCLQFLHRPVPWRVMGVVRCRCLLGVVVRWCLDCPGTGASLPGY